MGNMEQLSHFISIRTFFQDSSEFIGDGPYFSFLVVETNHAGFDGGRLDFAIIFQ
jgi:hypothetical protein